MSNKQNEETALCPLPRNFEQVGNSIPLDVIQELFDRMELSQDLKKKFFKQVENKRYSCISGKVGRIKTNRDGTTSVTIESTARGEAPGPNDPTALTNYFYGPADYNQQILDEFKRAQSAGLCVKVCFQSENGARVINSVEVFKCPG